MTSKVRSSNLLEEAEQMALLARDEIRHGRLRRTLAVMMAFAAAVSGWEAWGQHVRGAFRHWLMWTPVVLTPPAMIVAGASVVNERATRLALPWTSIVMLIDGVIGFAYHMRGIGRLPGGFKAARYNITMGPPVFAPLLLTTVGVLGILAALSRPERLRRSDKRR